MKLFDKYSSIFSLTIFSSCSNFYMECFRQFFIYYCFSEILQYIFIYLFRNFNIIFGKILSIAIGVAVNAMFTGLSSVFNSMKGGNVQGVAAIVNGNIAMKTWDDVKTLFPYVVVGLVIAALFISVCNILMLEDKTIRNLGINVNRMRMMVSLIAVLLAAISTAIVGSISFLGLIVPHMGRLLVGSDHKRLIPFSILLGAFVFLTADTLGRTIAAPYEVSAAIIMSVIGGPFFIILLRRSNKYGK